MLRVSAEQGGLKRLGGEWGSVKGTPPFLSNPFTFSRLGVKVPDTQGEGSHPSHHRAARHGSHCPAPLPCLCRSGPVGAPCQCCRVPRTAPHPGDTAALSPGSGLLCKACLSCCPPSFRPAPPSLPSSELPPDAGVPSWAFPPPFFPLALSLG